MVAEVDMEVVLLVTCFGVYANSPIKGLFGAEKVILHGFCRRIAVYICSSVPFSTTNGATALPYLQLYTRVTFMLTSEEDAFR